MWLQGSMTAVSQDRERAAKTVCKKREAAEKVSFLNHTPPPKPPHSVNISKHRRHRSTMDRGSVCPQVTRKKKKKKKNSQLLRLSLFFPPPVYFFPLCQQIRGEKCFFFSPLPLTPARSDARSRTANKTEPSLQTAKAHFSILGESLSVCSLPHISRMEPPDTGLCQLD